MIRANSLLSKIDHCSTVFFSKPRRYAMHRAALFSTSSFCKSYADTVSNLRINEKTRVIFQGFTGRQVSEIEDQMNRESRYQGFKGNPRCQTVN